MEIIGYELHVKTHHSLGSIINALKSKGMEPDLKLSDESVKLELKHPGGSIHEFNVKLYKEYDGYKVYELKAHTEPEMNFLKETLKPL